MINLEQFINLCNLEGVYFYTSIEERDGCFRITLGSSPKIGEALDKLEPYYNRFIKNIDFIPSDKNMIILVTVE